MNYTVIRSTEKAQSAVEQVLLNRGLTVDKIARYLNPTADEIYPAEMLDNIASAAKTLLKALFKQEKVYVQIDSDCDGYTSSALLLNYLHRTFPTTVENYFYYGLHEKKHHGINMDNIPEGTKLVIVPDASSNEVDFHKELAERGIEVIVLDHHEAPVDNDDPAIIVNNQMCDYPNKALSGVGIVYKFCLVLDEILKVSYADDYLDLVALGMIADMMDLRELETRYYIVEGLKDIRNPLFLGLGQKNEFKIQGQYNPFTVSWYVSPFINAVTRSGTLEEKETLFKSMLEYEAYKLVPSTKLRAKPGDEELLIDQAIRVSGNVKNRQDKSKTSTLEMITEKVQELNEAGESVLIIQLEDSLDNNLNGLMANQIIGEYQKPVLILTKRDKDGVITWEGSSRGFAMDGILNWRSFIADSGYALYAEGHPFAFGTGFTPENLEGFKQYVKEYFADKKIEPCYAVDFCWSGKELSQMDNAILELADSRHIWGQEVKEPMIAVNVILKKENFALMGKGTLKITIPNTRTTCIKFGFGEERYEQIMSMFPTKDTSMRIVIVGNCRKNEYYGNVSPQIEIKDYDIWQMAEWIF